MLILEKKKRCLSQTFLLNRPCFEKIQIYPFVKVFFDISLKRCPDDHFSMSFSFREYISRKLEECIFVQKQSEHIKQKYSSQERVVANGRQKSKGGEGSLSNLALFEFQTLESFFSKTIGSISKSFRKVMMQGSILPEM